MVIVEGMDNSGKSTLANYLGEKFDLKIIKRSGPPASSESFLLETLSFLVLNPEAIFDRHPIISEGVYAPVLRGINVFETEGTTWEFWMDRLQQCNPLIIYCRPPDEKILCFHPDLPQMDGVEQNARRLIDRYDKLMDRIEKRGFLIIRHNFDQLINTLPVEYAVASYLKVKGVIKGYEYK